MYNMLQILRRKMLLPLFTFITSQFYIECFIRLSCHYWFALHVNEERYASEGWNVKLEKIFVQTD